MQLLRSAWSQMMWWHNALQSALSTLAAALATPALPNGFAANRQGLKSQRKSIRKGSDLVKVNHLRMGEYPPITIYSTLCTYKVSNYY